MKYEYVIIETFDGEDEVLNTQGFFSEVEKAFEVLKELEEKFPKCVFHVEIQESEEKF